MSGHKPSYSQQGHAQYHLALPGHADSGRTLTPAHPSDYSLDAGSSDVPTAAQGSISMSGQQWDDPQYSRSFAPDTNYSQQHQHYFTGFGHQSTDPSTYNSPWPPQSHASSFENQSSTYSGLTADPMPYFGTPTTGPVRPSDSLDGAAATSFPAYGQDIDVSGWSSCVSGNSKVQEGGITAEDNMSTMVFDDASMQLKNQSLPILDNLAAQLIQMTAKLNLSQMQEILSGSDTEESQAYNTLKGIFEHTRKVYDPRTPFIDAIAIQMFQPSQQETIRKANIATFISSVLGSHDVSFFLLDQYFLETFLPFGHRLLKWQGAIYLDLKTQAYISALFNSDATPVAMLDELFPPDLDAQILARHPDAPSLTPGEQDFLDRCRARKSYLRAEGDAETALKELPKKYQWIEFVREFAGCISKNVDAIMNASVRTQNASSERRSTLTNNNAHSINLLNSTTKISQNQPDSEANPKRPALPTSNFGAVKVRQGWTQPEEDALLSGLEKVNGPHWSQILILYGRGGSISEVLKNRNQVQLKDKARNLKLQYLKMGREVPNALRGVTGELRKRGGKTARAALDADADEGDTEGVDELDSMSEGSAAKRKVAVRGKTKKAP